MRGVARFGAVFLCLLSWSNIRGRCLEYDDIDTYKQAVSSDGVNNFEGSNFLESVKGSNDSQQQQQCQEVNGFLSCSSNLRGHIFLILLYEFLLYHGESFAGGDGRIFRYVGNNFMGLCFFQILNSLPISLILLGASGVWSSENEPNEYVQMGASILAGSSIFLLTILWGLCIIVGSTTYHRRPDSQNNLIQLLTGSGVDTDEDTSKHAKIMLFSLIPFVVILLPRLFGLSYTSQGYKIVVLVSLCVSGICLVSYFIYQRYNDRIGKRRQEYLEVERKINLRVPFYEVQKLMLDWENLLMNQKNEMMNIMTGENTSKTMTREEFFNTIQNWLDRTREQMDDPNLLGTRHNQVAKLLLEDKNKLIELLSIMLKNPIGKSLLNTTGSLDESGINSYFERIDNNGDGLVSKYELKMFIEYVNFKRIFIDHDIIEMMMRFLDIDGDGNIDQNDFKSGFPKLINETNHLPSSSEKRLQSVDNRETDEYNHHKGKETNTEMYKVMILVLVGIVMQVMVAGPLVESVRKLSESLKWKTFYVSFTIVPIATNMRTSFSATRVARQKTDLTTSVAFSEIYRKVFMNNIMGFIVLLSVVHFCGLTWNFSVAIYVMAAICLYMGLFAGRKSEFPIWRFLLPSLLYPVALGNVFYYYDY